MLKRTFASLAILTLSTLGACSARSPEVATSTTEAMMGGNDTMFPTVIITGPVAGPRCAGTMLADRWVLTSRACLNSTNSTSSVAWNVGNAPALAHAIEVYDHTSGASLLHLDAPLALAPHAFYPGISTNPVLWSDNGILCGGIDRDTSAPLEWPFDVQSADSATFSLVERRRQG